MFTWPGYRETWIRYLTFLDTILIVAFVITALTVVANVILKRLDTRGKVELAQRTDAYLLWGYPLFYVAGMVLLILIFLF
jgi:hypothetical protein